MKNRILLFVIVFLAVGLSTAFAGNDNRTGTSGALELRIPCGSRGSAMGGSVVANSNGVDAIYWNPAGLAMLEGSTEVMFTHLPYIADIDVEYFAVGHDIEDFGAIGVSLKVVNIGDIYETTNDAPEGTGRVFSPTMTVIGLSYARVLTSNVNFGATANFLYESIFGVTATGVALDFGFTYETTFPGLSLGFAMKNYGPDLEFSGNGFNVKLEDSKHPIQSKNASSELPTAINMGAAYNFLNRDVHSATVTGNFQANNQINDFWKGGFEYAHNGQYFLRTGYNYSPQDSYLYGASLGAGVVFDIGNTNLTFEYTWTQTEVFNDNQYFTMKASF